MYIYKIITIKLCIFINLGIGGKRMSELRRLQSRVRTLEEMNEALRGELTILHQLAPPALVQPNKEDKSTSIEVSRIHYLYVQL